MQYGDMHFGELACPYPPTPLLFPNLTPIACASEKSKKSRNLNNILTNFPCKYMIKLQTIEVAVFEMGCLLARVPELSGSAMVPTF